MSSIKTGKDLFVLAPIPGPSEAAQAPFLLPGSALQVLFLYWKKSPGTDAEGSVSDGVMIVTTQGAQIRVRGGLRVPEGFLSAARHVALLKLSLAGTVQVQGAPDRFELRLDSPLPPASRNEQVEEIQFRPEPDPEPAGL